LIGLYALTIYTSSYWTKLGQIVFSTLLAFALWKKVTNRLPYLTDTRVLPSKIDLSDGLVVAFCFSAFAGYADLIISRETIVREAFQLTMAQSIAGLLVVPTAVYLLSSRNVTELWEYVGLVSKKCPWKSNWLFKVLMFTALGGAGSVLCTSIYFNALTVFPNLRDWKEASEATLAFHSFGASAWAYGLFILFVPLCEEFIFRGLVYQGLRKSFNPPVAALMSAILFGFVNPSTAMIPSMGLGLATALGLERTGLLITPILIHATYNICILLLSR
jgi:membrane protease YdiL (CAAX protease family)